MTTPTPQEKGQAMTSPDEIEREDLKAFMRRRECLRSDVHLDNVIAESFWKTGANNVTYDQAKSAAEYLRTLDAPIFVTAELLDWVERQEARISALEAKLEEGLAAVNKLGEHHFDILTENDKRVIGVVLHQARTALKGDDNE